MELHTKQLQIDMNSAVAAQLCPPQNKGTQLADRSQTAKQNKSLHGGTVAHMKTIT